MLKEKVHIGCVSQDSDLWKVGKLGSNASVGYTAKFSRGMWHQIKIRERKGPSRGIIRKCEPHERNPCVPRFEERSQEETSRQESGARQAKNMYKLKNKDKTAFYSHVEVKAPIFISQSPIEFTCLNVLGRPTSQLQLNMGLWITGVKSVPSWRRVSCEQQLDSQFV